MTEERSYLSSCPQLPVHNGLPMRHLHSIAGTARGASALWLLVHLDLGTVSFSPAIYVCVCRFLLDVLDSGVTVERCVVCCHSRRLDHAWRRDRDGGLFIGECFSICEFSTRPPTRDTRASDGESLHSNQQCTRRPGRRETNVAEEMQDVRMALRCALRPRLVGLAGWCTRRRAYRWLCSAWRMV